MKQSITYFLIATLLVYGIYPMFASDMQEIAFICSPADQNNAEIFKMVTDGSNLQQITRNRLYDSTPRWSPNANQIFFISAYWNSITNSTSNETIYRIKADASDVEQLTDPQSPAFAPTWSPDSEWIAFISYSGDPTKRELYKMRADGKDLTELTSGLEAGDPDWSPDGEWITFVSQNNILYRIHPDGTDLQLLTATGKYIFAPKWSPDSNWIVFLADLTEIYRIGGNGNDKQLLATEQHVRAANWSPSGTFLTYAVSNGKEDELFYTTSDGSNRHLVYSAIGNIVDPTWSRNEHQLFFSFGGNVRSGNYRPFQIYTVDIDGSNLTQLTDLPCNAWDLNISPN